MNRLPLVAGAILCALAIAGGAFGAHAVPQILQMSADECGAACLAMILSYFGRKTRLPECHEKCDAGRDGVTALESAEGRLRAGATS